MRRLLPIILLIALAILGINLGKRIPQPPERFRREGQLTVHFIDVGQGDCTLIRTPDGRNLLIDGGDQNAADKVIRYLSQQGIRRIDLLIISHPHADHIGGLPAVLDNFGISCVVDPGCEHGSPIYEMVLRKIEERRIDYRLVGKDQMPIISKDIHLDLFCTEFGGDTDSELNNSSVVALIRYKNVGVLLTGDIQYQAEAQLLAAHRNLKADILKVAHHGSADSTSNEFLEVVKPAYAVISVGSENEYGHPARSTLRRLNAAGVKVFRTDRDGDVIFSTDGEWIDVVTSR
ncbi:MAG: ComEC/Rec2 family competence protein [Armatimonadota bacterium]|nr:ComEC/Rec2 family competence protein [Armatimonadota bacterium]